MHVVVVVVGRDTVMVKKGVQEETLYTAMLSTGVKY